MRWRLCSIQGCDAGGPAHRSRPGKAKEDFAAAGASQLLRSSSDINSNPNENSNSYHRKEIFLVCGDSVARNASISLKSPSIVACDTTFEAVNEPCGLNTFQLSRLDDEQLTAHLLAGHDDALAILFDRYNRLVYAIARNILQDEGEAEDLTQAVFFEIFRSMGKFDRTRGTTKGWLLQIAYSRSLSRKHYLNIRSFYSASGSEGSLGNETATCEISSNLNLEERKRLVQQALQMLSEPQRETLRLTFFQGLSASEIARLRNESEGNVRHHYYRGLKKLRSIIYDDWDSSTSSKGAE